MGLLSFFGRKQNKSQSLQAQVLELPDSTRKKLREELERDPNKEFDPEWIRITDLKRVIVDKYGFEGIKLIFEHRNSANYFNLGELPEDCPWFGLNNKSIKDCIAENFRPVKSKIPLLISAMKERCEFIFAEKTDNDWHLHYLLKMKLHDKRDYYRIYIGGSPKTELTTNSNLKLFDWKIPYDLREFFSVHDGFGERYDANFILSSEDIEVMGEMMNPITEEQGVKPEGYSFNDLLTFFPDGAGNAQCFIRTIQGNNQTVDWDHEVWEISEEIGFYEFINEQMSEIDEE